jgi:hypothetical protein
MFSYKIYQGTDMLPEIVSSSPHTRVFVARKLHEGASPRVILSDKHISGDIYVTDKDDKWTLTITAGQ